MYMSCFSESESGKRRKADGSLDNHFLSISQEIVENESPFEFSFLKAEGVENQSRSLLILLKGTNYD